MPKVKDDSREIGKRGSLPAGALRARPGAPWDERCAALFEDLRKPARVMVRRAFGTAFSEEGIEDVYAAAWTSTLAALRGRKESMGDEELRSYLLTAVANHAAKEMRRRSRRPTSPLEDAHAQVLADRNEPAPEEHALGAERSSIARDVLASLPPRRRAVMLLRYGWGLQPAQICSLVEGLSARAYRKEITRGVEEMLSRLKQVESGEWCASREPLLRDLVAGTAGEERERQALQHIGHCRSCGELVSRLSGQLHEAGSGFAWTAVAGSFGEPHIGIGERIAAVAGRGPQLGGEGAPAELAGSLAASGTGRGAGAAGAAVLAKVAGVGAAGKAALACLGAGLAATACVAGGLLPGVGPADAVPGEREAAEKRPQIRVLVDREMTPTPRPESIAVRPKPEGPPPGASRGPEAGGGSGGEAAAPEPVPVQTAPEGAPAGSPTPTAPPTEQEFGLAAAAAPAGSAPSTSSGSGSGSSSSGGSAKAGDVAREFGP